MLLQLDGSPVMDGNITQKEGISMIGSDIWTDNRSGHAGRLIGDLTLQRIAQKGEEFSREKGTTFSTVNRVVVGRVCSNAEYLLGDAHFCNISKAQHRGMLKLAGDKSLFYLFITLAQKMVNHWLVPAKIVGEVISQAKTKGSDKSCLLRIVETSGGRYVLNGKDITRYFGSYELPRSMARRLDSGETEPETAPIRVVRSNRSRKEVQVRFSGRSWKGVLVPG
jgi:hypothetical protein